MRSATVLSACAAVVLLLGACSHGSGSPHGHKAPAHEATHGTGPQPTTVDIQGAGEWKKSPHMRAYYDATVATFANGLEIDVDAYEARSFAIFREFARANRVSEDAMLDHLKLIPRQVVGIVKEDPAVLESYDAFWAALAGPD